MLLKYYPVPSVLQMCESATKKVEIHGRKNNKVNTKIQEKKLLKNKKIFVSFSIY